MQTTAVNVLLSIGWSVPVLLACIVGIAICAMNASRYPRPAVIGLAAFIILLLSGVIGAIPWWYLMPGGPTADTARWAVMAIALLRSLATTVALILLGTALFIDRGASADLGSGKS